MWQQFSAFVSHPMITPLAMKLATTLDPLFLRWSGGRYYFSFVIPVLLLKCVGAKTGKLREVPLLYVPHDQKYYVLGSHGALPTEPAWCINLRKTPDVRWLAQGVLCRGSARELNDNERSLIWSKALEIYPGYANYKNRLSRAIPIFELSPSPSGFKE